MPTAHELVARGAALLDEKLPGWADQIDVESLAMANECKCVLGQIGGARYNLDALTWEMGRPPKDVRFMEMSEALGLELDHPGEICLACQSGFDTGCLRISYDDLRDAWKGEIVARRTL